MDNILIEIASDNDYQIIADIYNDYITAGLATMEESLYNGSKIRDWVKNFNSKEALYVIKDNGKMRGWGSIKRYSDREGYRFTCETAVYISNKELNKGYGSLLKKFILKQCKEFGYHHLMVKIWSTNKTSIHYNLKLGYTIVGTQKEIGFRNGKWIDVVIMQYLIKS